MSGRSPGCDVLYEVDGHPVRGRVSDVDAAGDQVHEGRTVTVEFAEREVSLVRLAGDTSRADLVIAAWIAGLGALVMIAPAAVARVRAGTWSAFGHATRDAFRGL